MKGSPHVFTPFLRRFTDETANDLAATHRLYQDVQQAHLSSHIVQPDAITGLAGAIVDRVLELAKLPDYAPLTQALDHCQTTIFTQQSVLFDFPDFPEYLSMKEKVDLRRFLRAKQHFLTNEPRILKLFSDTMINVFGGFGREVAKLNFGPSSATVPLHALLPNVNDIVDRIIGTFCTEELENAGLFTELQQQLYENICIASGRPLDKESSKPFITAADSDLPPDDLVDTYLAKTPFKELFSIRVPFSINQETRFSGHWIIAPPGRGKTTLLHSMFLEDVNRNASIILMDSKGDLINPIREMKEIQDRLVIVEPDPDFPLALNPLDIPHANVARTIGLLEYFFSSLLEAKLTALQRTLFRNLLPALVQCVPDPTLSKFRDIVANGLDPYWQYFDNLSPLIKRFLETQFDHKTYLDTRNQLVWRLDFLMTNPLLAAMFNSDKTKFDIGKQMDAGKIIVINNSKDLLEDEGAEFFGRFFVALILSAAQQRSNRPRDQKLPCFVYIDECHNVIRRDERISTILDECRSQNIALILAHQRLEQIKSDDVLSALQNCAIRMANSDDDAKQLAPSLRTSTEFLQSLEIGQFALWTRDLKSQPAVLVDIPFVDLTERPRISNSERIALKDKTRAQFCNPAVSNTQPSRAEPKSPTPQPSPRPTPSKPEPAPKAKKSPNAESGEDW